MSRTVLYIEDDPNSARLVERVLKGPDVHVRVVTNARDGIAAARREPPALILLDNHLPDAAGRDVLRELAASESTRAIPVIILTGDTDRATAADLLALGAVDYIMKPYDIVEFKALIDDHLP